MIVCMHPLNLAQRGEINAEQSLVLTLFCKVCPAFLWKLETVYLSGEFLSFSMDFVIGQNILFFKIVNLFSLAHKQLCYESHFQQIGWTGVNYSINIASYWHGYARCVFHLFI